MGSGRRSLALTFAACVLVVLTAACRTHRAAAPVEVVGGLYHALATLQIRGAPSAAELAGIAPYLSRELETLLREARAIHDRAQAASPGEKPPFAEGDLFSSLFEGPTAFQVVADRVQDDAHLVTVRFTYDRASPAVVWTDEVVVRSENGRWVVADVQYGGGWDFANKGTLTGSVRSAETASSSD